MPALLIYLLKVNIALLLFCLGYYTILRRLTFYTINRIYLMMSIIFCSLYPAINFSGVVAQHPKLVRPLQIIVINLGTQVQHIRNPALQPDYWQWAVWIFWSGAAIMGLRLLIQLASLFNLYRQSAPGILNRQPVRLMANNTNPFSFWQTIYVNPGLYAEAELTAIVAHEQVHVAQWHTLDVILAELSLIFYWFNPGMWFMKKAITENLEFITDHKILQQGIDARSYQYSLLYTCINTSSNAIVNHFNISTIKKRITMMNSKNSPAISLGRYTLVAPVILVLLLCFNFSEAAFYTKNHVIKTLAMAINITKNQPTVLKKALIMPAKDIVKRPNPAVTAIDTVKKQIISPNDTLLKDQDDYNFYLDNEQLTREQLKTFDMGRTLLMIPLSIEETEKVFGLKKHAVVFISKNNKDAEGTKALIAKIESAHGEKIILPGTVNGAVDALAAKNPVTIIGTDGIIYDNEASDKSPVILNLSQVKKTGILVVIDDKPQPQDRLDNLDELSGDHITGVTFLNKKDAISKYGDKGSKGAVIIATTFFKNK